MGEFPEIDHAHGGDRQWHNILPDPVLSSLQVHVLCAFRWVFHRGWDFRNVSEAFSRLYLIESGSGVIGHHGHRYRLRSDHLYLIPAHTVHSHTTTHRPTSLGNPIQKTGFHSMSDLHVLLAHFK